MDYLAWCKELKYDLTNMFFYFPKNFKKVHDRTAAEYQAVQDKKAAEKKRREEERIKREAEVMKKLLEEMLKENAGIDNAFLPRTTVSGITMVGIRTAESVQRLQNIASMTKAGNKLTAKKQVFPIYDWTDNDVWLFLLRNHVDILGRP